MMNDLKNMSDTAATRENGMDKNRKKFLLQLPLKIVIGSIIAMPFYYLYKMTGWEITFDSIAIATFFIVAVALDVYAEDIK